jgi:hypothetical protein
MQILRTLTLSLVLCGTLSVLGVGAYTTLSGREHQVAANVSRLETRVHELETSLEARDKVIDTQDTIIATLTQENNDLTAKTAILMAEIDSWAGLVDFLLANIATDEPAPPAAEEVEKPAESKQEVESNSTHYFRLPRLRFFRY